MIFISSERNPISLSKIFLLSKLYFFEILFKGRVIIQTFFKSCKKRIFLAKKTRNKQQNTKQTKSKRGLKKIMFTSIKAYLSFFHKARFSQNIPLVYGETPKVTFTANGAVVCYIFLMLPTAFFTTTLFQSLSNLGILGIIASFLFHTVAFFIIFIGFQATYFDQKGLETSFTRLARFNLTKLCKFLDIPFYSPYKLNKPYTKTLSYSHQYEFFNKDQNKNQNDEENTNQNSQDLKNIKSYNTNQSNTQNNQNQSNKENHQEQDFCLMLGKSTGFMSSLWHSSSLAPEQNIFLNLEDATKNILVLGGIGSGKTSAIMQPLLLQLLDQNCGGLIFDIKGDVKDATMAFAEHTNREINIIGPHHDKINLIADLSPEVASSFLKSSLLLANQGHLDLFWIDTATELSRNILGMLSFVPKYYTLADLYQYIFDKEAEAHLEEKLTEIKEQLPPDQKRLFNTYHQYKTNIFDQFDDKVKSGVKATLAQAISPFNHPDLTDAFCSSKSIKINEILTGSVFLVDMPISTWGLGAKVVYTFIKLRFFNLMQKHSNSKNRKLPVFFMCDEFQEIVSCNRDGLSDLNFWDKSRSSKTIGIISAQSIASFFAATPNRDFAYALLQNFRNKLCLTSEDPLTIDYISQLTGKAKTKKKSTSSDSETISEIRDDVLEAQIFRSLPSRAALALLSINNKSSDDAIHLFPIYLDENS
jgi:hypothetical protein